MDANRASPDRSARDAGNVCRLQRTPASIATDSDVELIYSDF